MADRTPEARTAAYAALVSAVADSRRDLMSARFDEELAAAEAAGRIDPAVARTLRWWQRESVRAVDEHLQAVLPGVLAGLETADREAAEAVEASAESWAAASGGEGGGRPLPPPVDPGPPAGPPPGGGPADPTATPYLRPVDRGPDDRAGGRPRLLRPGFAPPEAVAAPVAHDSRDGGAPPRRLLAAGLTVLTGDQVPGAVPSAPPRATLRPDSRPGVPTEDS